MSWKVDSWFTFSTHRHPWFVIVEPDSDGNLLAVMTVHKVSE